MAKLDCFMFDELSQFKQNLLLSIKTDFPEETKKFIQTEAKTYLKVTKKVARKEVGTSKGKKKNWIESKSYHKGFKVGKVYNYSGDLCCRVYNKSRHAHLVEYGHANVPRSSKRATTVEGRAKQAKCKRATGFTAGNFVFKIAELEFETQFLNDTEAFMFQYFDKTTKSKKGTTFKGTLKASW